MNCWLENAPAQAAVETETGLVVTPAGVGRIRYASDEGAAERRVVRAQDVNRRLCAAYMRIHQLTDGPLPDLSDVTVAEARECGAIVRADEQRRQALNPAEPLRFSVVISDGKPAYWFALALATQERLISEGRGT